MDSSSHSKSSNCSSAAGSKIRTPSLGMLLAAALPGTKGWAATVSSASWGGVPRGMQASSIPRGMQVGSCIQTSNTHNDRKLFLSREAIIARIAFPCAAALVGGGTPKSHARTYAASICALQTVSAFA
eukprot:scaffold52318_cov23-Tisochrysis_lutea.AAC.1